MWWAFHRIRGRRGSLARPAGVGAGRVVTRWWAHRKTARAELPAEALERLDFGFLWVVLSAAERPAIEAALGRAPEAVVRSIAALGWAWVSVSSS